MKCIENSMENWHADVRVQRVNSASKIVNSVGEKERKFLKHSINYVSCDSNENICEATITITFPCKQTMMKHDMDKFNFTQFECTIRNLVNLLVNRKKLYVFFLLLSF